MRFVPVLHVGQPTVVGGFGWEPFGNGYPLASVASDIAEELASI
jgi:hypothetical protein